YLPGPRGTVIPVTTPDVTRYSGVALMDNLDSTMQTVSREVQQEARKAIVKGAIGTEVADDVTRVLSSGTDELADLSKIKSTQTRLVRTKEAVKKFWANAKTGEFWKNMGVNLLKGAAIGAAEIWAGYIGFSTVWGVNDPLKTPPAGAATLEMSNAACLERTADGKCVWFSAEKITKSHTYKVTISKDSFNQRHYSIAEIQTDAQFKEMRDDIAAKKATLWESENCKDVVEKGIAEYMGSLAPSATKAVPGEYVIAYYVHNAAIANSVRARGVPEEDLMALLTTVSDTKESNLPISGLNIAKDWYKPIGSETEEQLQQRAVSYIDNAASKLASAEASSGSLGNAVIAISSAKDKQKHSALVVQARNNWATFKITAPAT
ncbi:MAG: hypothetical protein NTW59_02090, partial [Candidatus Diapherotrites archaeon]|nr:hypothetical protein [Candidatus Diapherotrites archaeon]